MLDSSMLVRWLDQHNLELIRLAALELTADAGLRETVEASIRAFFEGVRDWAVRGEAGLLGDVLRGWVSDRSMTTTSAETSQIPALVSIKRALWEVALKNRQLDTTLGLLTAFETLFNDSIQFVSRLEAEQLLAFAQAEINETRAVVQRIDQNKSDFVAVAAHELKTPLTIIEGYAAMLRKSLAVPELEACTPMLNGMASGTARLRDIIDDIIDVSMIDMHMLDMHFQPVWLRRLIESACLNAAPALRERRLHLDLHDQAIPDMPTYGDPERLYQVVQKVLANAIKYTPDGGRIAITARELPKFVDVQVRDTGIGIAPEQLPYIFEKFSSQADVATHSSGKVKFKGGGPGLGLAIAKGIMEAHGGSLWAESDGYDEKALPGSTFHIMIPMRTAPSDSALAPLFRNGQQTA